MNKHEVVLGQIIEGDVSRDAIHIAVAPVVASSKLLPSQDIGMVDPQNNPTWVGACNNPIGIVDPFLTSVVITGTKFWMFLYPNTITSLRHDWTHPAFESVQSTDRVASLQWMKNFAAEHYYYPNYYTQGEKPVNYTAEEIINHATDFLKTGDKHVQQGSESLRDSTDSIEFWQHHEAITGIETGDNDRMDVPFCCTC